MSSTLTINFSLRQNKAIERAIAFEALGATREHIGAAPVYVGLGSLWFQDFQMAHRILGINDMISIEGNESVYRRTDFNRPLRSIEVVFGSTSEVVPALLTRPDLAGRPWLAWMDYDREVDDERVEELNRLAELLEPGSALLTTFNAKAKNYGQDPTERNRTLVELFGPDVVGERPEDDFAELAFMSTLAECVLGYIQAQAITAGRGVEFVPTIRLVYRDSTYMATVGGLLVNEVDFDAVRAIVDRDQWIGFEESLIETHPLTVRELQAMMRLMPTDGALTAEAIRDLGFELEPEQISFFERHYLRYPTYAELR